MLVSEKDQLLYKQKVLSVAKYYIKFCEENELRYFAIAGTAIGAIRHKGIIPWDDDVDFVMPRSDYETFIELSRIKLSKNYDVFIPGESKDYHLTMVKICDANTSLLVSPRHKCVLGAFVDIFPLDGLPNVGDEGRKEYFHRYYKLRRIAESINTYYSINDFLHSICKGNFNTIKRIIISWYYHLRRKNNNIIVECEEILKQHSFDKSKYVAYFATNHGAKVISPKRWFEAYYYAEFEDFRLRLPIGIHVYLKQVYGDYMTLPPTSKRIPRHSYYYLNLNKRVTYKQAIKHLKYM